MTPSFPQPLKGLTTIPAAVLPIQYVSRPTLSPHHKLLWAVLTEAWGCLTGHPTAAGSNVWDRPRHTIRMQIEAWEWFFSDDERYVFAFVPVCQHLGVDPGDVRRAVKRVLTRHENAR